MANHEGQPEQDQLTQIQASVNLDKTLREKIIDRENEMAEQHNAFHERLAQRQQKLIEKEKKQAKKDIQTLQTHDQDIRMPEKELDTHVSGDDIEKILG